MLTVVLYIVIIFGGIVFLAGTALKSQQQTKGLARCKYCNSRLRFQGYMRASNGSGVAGYATVCQRCGREQSPRMKRATETPPAMPVGARHLAL